MEIEEYFGAITALEECLHIRQKFLGPGSEECAVTTTNICRTKAENLRLRTSLTFTVCITCIIT